MNNNQEEKIELTNKIRDINTDALGPLQHKKWWKAINRFTALRGYVKSSKLPGMIYAYGPYKNLQNNEVSKIFNDADEMIFTDFPSVDKKNFANALHALEESTKRCEEAIPLSETM